jgi:hypothetical protein
MFFQKKLLARSKEWFPALSSLLPVLPYALLFIRQSNPELPISLSEFAQRYLSLYAHS